MRIVSLLPSATEIVCALGLRDQLVGVTHECNFPADVAPLPKVTTTHIPTDATSDEIDELVRERLAAQQALYSLDVPTLQRLRPDLILTQALCDVCAVPEREVLETVAALPGPPRVLNLEPTTLDGVFDCIRAVGEAAHCDHQTTQLTASLRARVEAVQRAAPGANEPRIRVSLLEWIDPLFSCGHWNPQLVELAGGVEGHGRIGQKSRGLDWKEVFDWQPEVIFIACCGFSIQRTLADLPLLENQAGWKDVPAVRSGRVFIADGSAYFSRPGPRLVDSLDILAHTLHPNRHRLPPGIPPPRAAYALGYAWLKGVAIPALPSDI